MLGCSEQGFLWGQVMARIVKSCKHTLFPCTFCTYTHNWRELRLQETKERAAGKPSITVGRVAEECCREAQNRCWKLCQQGLWRVLPLKAWNCRQWSVQLTLKSFEITIFILTISFIFYYQIINSLLFQCSRSVVLICFHRIISYLKFFHYFYPRFQMHECAVRQGTTLTLRRQCN